MTKCEALLTEKHQLKEAGQNKEAVLPMVYLKKKKEKAFTKEDQRAAESLKGVLMLTCVIVIIISFTPPPTPHPALAAQVDRHGNPRREGHAQIPNIQKAN